MRHFTIFQDKLHLVNIQDDQSWAFSKTVQKKFQNHPYGQPASRFNSHTNSGFLHSRRRPRTLKGFTGELRVSFDLKLSQADTQNKILSASECCVCFFCLCFCLFFCFVLFFHIMCTVISLFVTIMNHSYISVSELPFFHIHVRLHLKRQIELYAFT